MTLRAVRHTLVNPVDPQANSNPVGAPAWLAGTLVGRFTLLVPLAQGGMAEIWLARQSGLRGFEKLVVIKRMTRKLANDPEYLEMFFSEAQLAAGLNHPNVVQIFDLGEHEDTPYIVMEYLDGEDLHSVRRAAQKLGRPMPDAFAAKYIALAAEGLHYAHTRVGHDGRPLQIVHRDVSPQNLVCTMDGGLKVVDFGIAKLASTATFSGKIKGKLAYMSPEQARGEELDARSDVFALGVVMFELLTRTRLTPKLNDLQLLDFMASDEPFDVPSARREDLPGDLEAIISRALARRREDRFQSARELQDALESWLVAQKYAVTANDLRDWLRDVFAARIVDRRKLIDAALHMDTVSPSAAHDLAKLAQRDSTGSRSTSASPLRPRKVLPLAIAAGVAIAVIAGGIAFWPKSSTAEPVAETAPLPPPPKPVVVEPPPPAPKEEPKVVRQVLIIDTVPTGAALTIDGESRGNAPQTIEDLAMGTVTIEAVLDGYARGKREVTLEQGERVRVELALTALPKRQPNIVKKTPAAVKAAPGKLSLKTTPWTQVFLGKKKLGDTPLVNVTLPAGTHQLRLVAPDTGAKLDIEVEIKSGETTVKKLKL